MGVNLKEYPSRVLCGAMIALFGVLSNPGHVAGQVLSIDLDRLAPGVQDSREWVVGSTDLLQGAVSVEGEPGILVGAYAVEVRILNGETNRTTIGCAQSGFSEGDVLDSGGDHVVETCTGRTFRRTSLFVAPAVIGPTGAAALFHFDLAVRCDPGDVLDISFTPSETNPQFGVEVAGQTRSVGGSDANSIEARGAVLFGVAPTPTPSPTPSPTPPTQGLIQVIEGMRLGTHTDSDLLRESLRWMR